ncbi:MAG: glucose 1-dehydrogenase [Rhodospirillales bacterium]|nr:MAG: glucose 1-dehydrogenase [Rhodospirillales bacterium]
MTQGYVALVTGAGSGIGRATALRFLAAGASVVATDLNAVGLAETARQVDSPARMRTLVQDVTADDAPRQAVDLAVAEFGGLDWVVTNAGIGGAKPMHETEDADFDRFMNVNVRSVFRYARESLRILKPGRGSIVHVASIYGILGYPGSSSYSASKAAVIGITHQMAADYGPLGIRVNAVAPGVIETGMTRDRVRDSPRFKALMIDTTPYTRTGQPEDIANAINFLCSDQAEFINGHVLTVDGGWSVTNHIAGAPPA